MAKGHIKEVKDVAVIVPHERQLLSEKKRESLVAWFNLYMGIEGRAGSEHTFAAKKRDLETFLSFLQTSAGTDHPDQWTRSLTRDFLRHLERKLERSPTTINRSLATLRHCSSWINSQRPFLAGNPCDRIPDLELDDPEWKGLKPIEITVSFRQACLNVFCMIASVVVFQNLEDDHGWTKTSRDSGGSDTWAGSL